MATPILERRVLSGTQGDIHLEILVAGDRSPRPAVIVLHGYKGVEDRLARAGFTTISYRPNRSSTAEDLADIQSVLAALERDELGTPHPTSVGIVGNGRGWGLAIMTAARSPQVAALVTGFSGSTIDADAAGARVTVPWLRMPDGSEAPPDLEEALDQTTGWLARHLP